MGISLNFAFIHQLGQSLLETMSMVGLAGACVLLIGIPMSVLLVVTDRSGLFAHERVHNLPRNAFRAWNTVPFLVQLVLALSLTHWLSGTAGGVYATIFPLTRF